MYSGKSLRLCSRKDGEDVDENGNPYIRKSTFAKLRKLDSFIKESQRWSGLGLGTLNWGRARHVCPGADLWLTFFQ